MKRILVILALLLACAAAGSPARATASAAPAADQRWPVTPATKPDGSRWRIGYYEGGQYPDYEVILKAIVRGLVALGWVEPLDLPSKNDPQAGGFWNWLVANARSKYVEFVPDGYYAAGNFDKALRPQVKAALIDRLATRKDIDLVIAMGTWAGQDLATDAVSTPVIVASTSDPVASGIATSETDSGHDHLNAKVEPHRYARQVELFNDIFHFGKLGLVYEDSPEGRTFAAVDDIERLSKERGFSIVRCFAPFNGVPQEQVEKSTIDCYDQVARTADAVYITVHRGVTLATLPKILAPLYARDIPTFSMLGETEVAHGVLMSVAQSNYVYVGRFHAETIARIFHGARPRELPQVWQAPAKIALNLRTAEDIGYDPPVDIFLASDEIFNTIAPPP